MSKCQGCMTLENFRLTNFILKANCSNLSKILFRNHAMWLKKNNNPPLNKNRIAPVFLFKGKARSQTFELDIFKHGVQGKEMQKGVYYISEGNHRIVAANEILKTTGNAGPINQLIANGLRLLLPFMRQVFWLAFFYNLL